MIMQGTRDCNIDSINFEPETDCKSAFSDEKAFYSFRRQRDIFYELYNSWKVSQSQPTSFSPIDPRESKSQFEATVDRLITFSYDASNSYHLSKLFISQLIRTCIMAGSKDLLTNDHPNQFLSFIQNDKLKKLRKRLDQSSSKLPSTFNDEERFFYDLIVRVKCPSFLHYLKFMLIRKIKETNHCYPSSGECDQDLIISEINNIKPKFNQLSLTLQVLAKFLGLVVYLPFQISKSSSPQFIETQVSLRKDESCDINIIELLKDAIDKRKLSLTLPWILQFLRQMDSISPRLKCYQEIIRFICKVDEDLQTNKIKCDTNTRAYMINIIECFISNYREYKYMDTDFSIGNLKDSSSFNFDEHRGLIDEDYTAITPEALTTVNITSPIKSPQKDVKLTPRKIRPLTLSNKLSTGLSSIRQEQFQEALRESSRDLVREIENDFLSLHPLSLVKVIDLVSDRVYSRCIKELKHSAIYQAQESLKGTEFSEIDGNVDLNRKTNVDAMRKFCSHFSHDYCFQETMKILPLLLSHHDYSQETMDFASKLTAHKSCEKCCQWIISNINPQWLSNHFKVVNSCEDRPLKDVPDIFNAFGMIRRRLREMLFKRKPKRTDKAILITKLFADLSALRSSPNMPDRYCKIIDQSIFDLIITAIKESPDRLDNAIIKCWIDYWNSFDIKLKRLICERNITLLNSCHNNISSWDKFEFFLAKVVDSNIYPMSSFEGDCLVLLQNNKDERLLISSIKSIISNRRSKSFDLVELSNFLAQLDDIEFPALS